MCHATIINPDEIDNVVAITEAHKNALLNYQSQAQISSKYRRKETRHRLDYIDNIDKAFLSNNFFAGHSLDDNSISLTQLETTNSKNLQKLYNAYQNYLYMAPAKIASKQEEIERQSKSKTYSYSFTREVAVCDLLAYYGSFTPFLILITAIDLIEAQSLISGISWFDFIPFLRMCHEFLMDQIEELVNISNYIQKSNPFDYQYFIDQLHSRITAQRESSILSEAKCVLDFSNPSFMHSSLPQMQQMIRECTSNKSEMHSFFLYGIFLMVCERREIETTNATFFSQVMTYLNERFIEFSNLTIDGQTLNQVFEEACYTPEALFARLPHLTATRSYDTFKAARMPNAISIVLPEHDKNTSTYRHTRGSPAQHRNNTPNDTSLNNYQSDSYCKNNNNNCFNHNSKQNHSKPKTLSNQPNGYHKNKPKSIAANDHQHRTDNTQ